MAKPKPTPHGIITVALHYGGRQVHVSTPRVEELDPQSGFEYQAYPNWHRGGKNKVADPDEVGRKVADLVRDIQKRHGV